VGLGGGESKRSGKPKWGEELGDESGRNWQDGDLGKRIEAGELPLAD
jgi:hypothetical protein